jgi:hypothetical protein
VIAVTNPFVGNPDGVLMRWTFPAAGGPDVMISIPAMVAVNPHEASLRRWASMFDNRWGRPDANGNLRKGSNRDERESKQYGECNFLHDKPVLLG